MNSTLTDVQKEMIEEFQCPGCGCGSDTSCPQFYLEEVSGNFRCKGHGPGTVLTYGHFARTIALGMPMGFNKGYEHPEHSMIILYENPSHFKGYLNDFNIAFWALEKDGYLFVRIYQPRINKGMVAVIKGGKKEELCPDAMDVASFPEGSFD